MEIKCHGNALLNFYHFITMPFSKDFAPPFTQGQLRHWDLCAKRFSSFNI